MKNLTKKIANKTKTSRITSQLFGVETSLNGVAKYLTSVYTPVSGMPQICFQSQRECAVFCAETLGNWEKLQAMAPIDISVKIDGITIHEDKDKNELMSNASIVLVETKETYSEVSLATLKKYIKYEKDLANLRNAFSTNAINHLDLEKIQKINEILEIK